jgi:hypothetical protein
VGGTVCGVTDNLQQSLVFAVETGRGILLTPNDPDNERALKVADRLVKRHRHALRDLAK